MRRIYRILFALHLFVGIGAIFGGLAAIIDPIDPLGVPNDLLENSPFRNYLIPGIILFSILGLGNIIGALIFRLKRNIEGYAGSVLGCALVIWIVVQCIILRTVSFLHVLFFLIGLFQGVFAAIIILKGDMFPVNIIRKAMKGKGHFHGKGHFFT